MAIKPNPKKRPQRSIVASLDRVYTRRDLFKHTATLGALASVPAWLFSGSAFAAEKCNGQTPKSALQYQEKPKGDQRCSNCMHFCPGPKPSAMGGCKIVKGSINPKGWCTAWVAKS